MPTSGSDTTEPADARVRARAARPAFGPGWERAVLVHVSVLVVGLSWWFGGQSPGARVALLVWSTAGIALFFAAAGWRRRSGAAGTSPLRHLWPLLLFDMLVGLSCLNPSTLPVLREGEAMFMFIEPRWPGLPSTARPDLTLRELWQFNGIVVSCYNVFLVLERRSLLRQLLVVLAANALGLAVFGTFQKLAGATGLWFGAVASPQKYFFATFVYHNHWGAFTVLNLAACLALLFHALRRGGHRDTWHSPVPLGAVAILFIAATAPLSASRSTTLLLALFLTGALVHFLAQLVRRRRARHESSLPIVGGVVFAALVAVAAVLYLSRDVVRDRLRTTVEQIAEMRSEDERIPRGSLYVDTWQMVRDRPAFGWGLETYGTAFRLYNTQRARELVFGQRYYREAHSDWLQSLAEVGFVGTALLMLLGAAPLAGVRWRQVRSPVPAYLLAGASLVLLYAWVEFPLANPSVMLGLWLALYAAARYARADVVAQEEQR
jgi:O-antigen ligase